MQKPVENAKVEWIIAFCFSCGREKKEPVFEPEREMKKGFLFTVTEFLQGAAGNPRRLMLFTLAVVILLLLLVLLLAYFLRCRRMAQTAFSGIFEVQLELNKGCGEERSQMDMGVFRIGIEDCGLRERVEAAGEELFFPHLGFWERLEQRSVRVGTILKRYTSEYQAAGLEKDSSYSLLRLLSADAGIFASLGELRYSGRKGLVCDCGEGLNRQPIDRRALSLTLPLPSQYASQISAEAAEQIQKLCITIRYV